MLSRPLLGLSLLAVVGPFTLRGDERAAAPPPDTSVRERLDEKITVEFRRTPLHAALDEIGELVKLKIVLDGNALKRFGYTRNMALSHACENAAAGKAVAAIVAKHPGMTFVVDEIGGRVVVTTSDGVKAVQPPPRDEREAAAWREVVSAEQLATEIRYTRRELGQSLASPRGWRSREEVDRAAGRLAWLFLVSARHPEGLPPAVAVDLAAASLRLQSAARSTAEEAREDAKKAYASVNATLRVHADSVTSPAVKPNEPRVVLSDVMPRLEQALNELNAAARQNEIPEEARRRLSREAAVAAAAGRFVVSTGKHAGDAEFREHAEMLSSDFTATRRAVERGDHEAVQAGLASAVKRCVACHQSFR